MSWYRPGLVFRLSLPLARLPGANPGDMRRQDLSVLALVCAAGGVRLVGFGDELEVVEVGEHEEVGVQTEVLEDDIEAAATVIFLTASTVWLRASFTILSSTVRLRASSKVRLRAYPLPEPSTPLPELPFMQTSTVRLRASSKVRLRAYPLPERSSPLPEPSTPLNAQDEHEWSSEQDERESCPSVFVCAIVRRSAWTPTIGNGSSISGDTDECRSNPHGRSDKRRG